MVRFCRCWSEVSYENRDNMFLWNVGIFLQVHSDLLPRRRSLTSTFSPIWKFQVEGLFLCSWNYDDSDDNEEEMICSKASSCGCFFVFYIYSYNIKSYIYLTISTKWRAVLCIHFYIQNFKFKSKMMNWYLVFTGIIL